MLMKKKNVILIFVLSVIGIPVLYFSLSVLLGVDLYNTITLKSRIVKFIYHTDHNVFLADCRQLIKDDYRGQYIFKGFDRNPEVKKFPKEIADLNPTYLTVYDNQVSIELVGGMSHCRIIAYSENYDEEQVGSKRLIDDMIIT